MGLEMYQQRVEKLRSYRESQEKTAAAITGMGSVVTAEEVTVVPESEQDLHYFFDDEWSDVAFGD